MTVPSFNPLKILKPLPNLNNCKCGSSNITIAEKFTLGIQTYAIIKCYKCDREIKRRTYKRAVEAWNKNNPKKEGVE